MGTFADLVIVSASYKIARLYTVGVLYCLFGISCGSEDKPIGPISVLSEFQLITPSDGLKDVETDPLFVWSSAGEFVNYTLIISKYSDFDESIRFEGILDTMFEGFILDESRYYYWKVVAENNARDSITSDNSFKLRTVFTTPTPTPNIADYYVGETGLDLPENGTEDNPFKTMSYACKIVPSGEGDVIHVSAGTYFEVEPIKVPIGVSIKGAGTDLTIVESDGVTLSAGTNKEANNYKENFEGTLFQLISERQESGKGALPPVDGNQLISGLTIDGKDKRLKAGVWVQNRNNVELSDLVIKNCEYRGAVVSTGNVSGAGSFFLTGIKVHDVRFENSGKDLSDETLGNLCLGSLDGAEVFNIDIKDQEGYGIKFFIRGYFKNCIFHDIKTDLNEKDIKWGEKIAIELWNLGPGNRIYNVQSNTWLSLVNDPESYGDKGSLPNVVVENVQIIDKDGVSSKEAIELAVPHSVITNSFIKDKGFGIAVWDMGREDILIHHNIFQNTTYKSNWTLGPAVYIDNSRDWFFDDIRIFNNVFDRHFVGIQIKGSKLKNISIKNNLFIEPKNEDIQTVIPIKFENNFKYHTGGNDWKFIGTVNQKDNLLGDPMLVMGSDFWYSAYEPATGSPLIDSGQDVGVDYIGSAPDIGFFEK